MKKIYLVDVSSIFFRAFYAIRRLSNSKGLPTNGLYGFLAAMTKILKEHQPDGIAFCFDSPEPSFREEIYGDYKANRDEAPDELVEQLPYLKNLAEALNVPIFDLAGFEADDLIGTVAKKIKKQGYEVIIVSGDKDFGQLVERGVSMFDPSKDEYMTPEGVRGKLGVDPDQVIDYLAIVGDASDNVPGVRGIGPKGAVKLLNEFKTLKGVYDNLDKIQGDRTKELLKESKEMAFLSQKLVTIHCDAPVEVSAEDLHVRPVKRELLIPLLEELEFKSLLQRLLGESSKKEMPAEKVVEVSQTVESKPALVVSNVQQIEKLLPKEVKQVWLDVTPRGIALNFDSQPIRYEGAGEELARWLAERFRSGLEFSGFDTKTAARQLKLNPSVYAHVGHDALLEAYCLGIDLDLEFRTLVKKYLGRDLPEFPLSEERLALAQAMSARFSNELKRQTNNKILDEVEKPLSPILYQMEQTGVLIDISNFTKFSADLLKEAQSLEKQIHASVGYEFNVGSPKQLGQVLFEKLKLPPLRKTKTGYSTDSDVLEKLKSQHPICAQIVDWRELMKLRSTYADVLPRLIDPETGRVHTSFNQAVASTGRLSSANPNLQNIPIRTPRGQKIRESFIAPKGSVILSADYSQIELRILAHITGDQGLKRAFESDTDIHTATAAEVFDVKIDQVTPDHRRAAKAINFGIAYGMSDFGLAESLDVSREVAAEYITKYFKRYPGVQKYMHDVVEQGREKGFVETLYGRRRYYSDLKSSNYRLRQNAERQTINMPIQGAAADIIKLAMIRAAWELGKNKSLGAMILQVHDELVFEVPEVSAEETKRYVKDWMENAVKLSVPLRVSIGVGGNWGAAH